METKKLTNRDTEVLIKWIMFTAAITGMAIISALYPLQGNIPLIVIPSVLVLIFSKPVFFERLKLTTLLTMRILIVLAALRLFNPQVFVDCIMLMLIINILEATFTDLLRYKKYFNAVSGFALALGVILDMRHSRQRKRPAVGSLQQARLFQRHQIAPNRFRRHLKHLRQIGDAHGVFRRQQIADAHLPLLRNHCFPSLLSLFST